MAENRNAQRDQGSQGDTAGDVGPQRQPADGGPATDQRKRSGSPDHGWLSPPPRRKSAARPVIREVAGYA
jgi:hypothetical protein